MFSIFSDELANTPEIAANDWGNQVVISKVIDEIKDTVVNALGGYGSSQELLDELAGLMEEAIADSE